jgi:hypothetical protein
MELLTKAEKLCGPRFMSRAGKSGLPISQIAERYLAMLAEAPDELARFMSETGLSPDSLRGSVGSAALDTGLVDHLVANEPALLALCANAGWRPEDVMRSWQLNSYG